MKELKIPGAFPQELADAIARKADAMARQYEDQAIQEMVRAAKAELGKGAGPAQIMLDMKLE